MYRPGQVLRAGGVSRYLEVRRPLGTDPCGSGTFTHGGRDRTLVSKDLPLRLLVDQHYYDPWSRSVVRTDKRHSHWVVYESHRPDHFCDLG